MEFSLLNFIPLILLPFLLVWLGFIVAGRLKKRTLVDASKEKKTTGFIVNRWWPRAFALIFVLAASIYPVADAIQSGIVFVSVLPHLVPAGLLLGALVLGWIRPRAGAIAFIMIVAIVLAKKGPAGSVIYLPLLLYAVLFWFVETPEIGKAC